MRDAPAKQTVEPFAILPQAELYSTNLDDLDIRLLGHFHGTHKLKGDDGGPFTHSVSSLQRVFPHWTKKVYRRKIAAYVKAGVLKFSRFKVLYGKRTPFYTFEPAAVKTLCGLNRPYSNNDGAYVVSTDRIRKKVEGRNKEGTKESSTTKTGNTLNQQTPSEARHEPQAVGVCQEPKALRSADGAVTSSSATNGQSEIISTVVKLIKSGQGKTVTKEQLEAYQRALRAPFEAQGLKPRQVDALVYQKVQSLFARPSTPSKNGFGVFDK